MRHKRLAGLVRDEGAPKLVDPFQGFASLGFRVGSGWPSGPVVLQMPLATAEQLRYTPSETSLSSKHSTRWTSEHNRSLDPPLGAQTCCVMFVVCCGSFLCVSGFCRRMFGRSGPIFYVSGMLPSAAWLPNRDGITAGRLRLSSGVKCRLGMHVAPGCPIRRGTLQWRNRSSGIVLGTHDSASRLPRRKGQPRVEALGPCRDFRSPCSFVRLLCAFSCCLLSQVQRCGEGQQ